MEQTPQQSLAVTVLYLLALALLPWSWFPPFPWLHPHAQWSDAVFAGTAGAWLWGKWRKTQGWQVGLREPSHNAGEPSERRRSGDWAGFRSSYIAAACYFGAASLSLLLAAPSVRAGIPKLIGIGELCALFVITSDVVNRPGMMKAIRLVVTATSLLAGIAAIAGLALFFAGVPTALIGSYGDLVPSPWYARVQAGTYNPNLLASYCIFAYAVIASDNDPISPRLKRWASIGLWITVLLTFSRGILGFILAALIRKAETPGRRKLAVVYAAGCVLVIASLTWWNLSLDPSHPLRASLTSEPPTVRRQALVTSFQSLLAHPLFGTGLGTSPGMKRAEGGGRRAEEGGRQSAVGSGGKGEGGGRRAESSRQSAVGSWRRVEGEAVPVDAHFTFLNIGATLGLPALAAFVWLIVALWRGRGRPTDLAIWGGLTGLGLDGLGQDIEDFRHLWVLLGLAAADSESTGKDSWLGPKFGSRGSERHSE